MDREKRKTTRKAQTDRKKTVLRYIRPSSGETEVHCDWFIGIFESKQRLLLAVSYDVINSVVKFVFSFL